MIIAIHIAISSSLFPALSTGDRPVHYDSQPYRRRRRQLLVVCTCNQDDYWNARRPHFTKVLERIPQLVPAIETHEFMVGHGTNFTCEEAFLRTLLFDEYSDSTSTIDNKNGDTSETILAVKPTIEAYEILYSPGCRRDKLHANNLLLLNHSRKMTDWGEVFHSKDYKCTENDRTMNLYRSNVITDEQEKQCRHGNFIHFPKVVDWAMQIAEYRNESLSTMLRRRRTRDEATAALKQKTKFAALITQTTWKEFYAVDALVRHALCRILTQQRNQQNSNATML